MKLLEKLKPERNGEKDKTPCDVLGHTWEDMGVWGDDKPMAYLKCENCPAWTKVELPEEHYVEF